MHLVHKRILLSDEGRKLTECEAHMRRANQRQFKDEFIPRMTWEGMKEGYYFTTGFRGTGYYLDDTWCEYNDPDEDGYVLVRAAPAVAMHRVLPKRGKVGKQGLLFDKEVLDAALLTRPSTILRVGGVQLLDEIINVVPHIGK